METAAERLVTGRKVSSMLFVPYIFFPGIILKRNVLGTMTQLQERYPGIPMAVTPPLGAAGQAAAVAAQRVQELWTQSSDRVQSSVHIFPRHHPEKKCPRYHDPVALRRLDPARPTIGSRRTWSWYRP